MCQRLSQPLSLALPIWHSLCLCVAFFFFPSDTVFYLPSGGLVVAEAWVPVAAEVCPSIQHGPLKSLLHRPFFPSSVQFQWIHCLQLSHFTDHSDLPIIVIFILLYPPMIPDLSPRRCSDCLSPSPRHVACHIFCLVLATVGNSAVGVQRRLRTDSIA